MARRARRAPPRCSDAAVVNLPARPSPAAALRYGWRLGCLSFGGPAGQIALLHREVVREHGWLGEDEFGRALNFCMLLPGPEALQLVIYIGWRWYGTLGGILAGLCFLVPAMLLLTALSFTFVLYGTLAPIAAAVTGLKAVVVALVIQALLRLGRRALKDSWHVAFAATAFAALAILKVPFPLIVIAGLVAGPVVFRRTPAARAAPGKAVPLGRVIRILGCGAALWALPLALLSLVSAGELPTRLYLFFSQAAVFGFGGAYAILAYVNTQLVGVLGWLSPPQLVAGLALAETTPGPLTLVLQFYGFVAGWNAPGAMAPASAALLSSALASWATFLPSFVLVLAGAPYLERVAAIAGLAAALEAVTAIVVGVIASFALAVAVAVLLPRGFAAPDWSAVVIAAGAGFAITRSRLGLPWILAGGAAAALVWARVAGA